MFPPTELLFCVAVGPLCLTTLGFMAAKSRIQSWSTWPDIKSDIKSEGQEILVRWDTPVPVGSSAGQATHCHWQMRMPRLTALYGIPNPSQSSNTFSLHVRCFSWERCKLTDTHPARWDQRTWSLNEG